MSTFWRAAHLSDKFKNLSPLDRIPLRSPSPPGRLYIGGLTALDNPTHLVQNGITHILSVLDFDFPIDAPDTPVANGAAPTYVRRRIDVADEPGGNLLLHFESACGFIDDALEGGGNVLVHCAMGVSRSMAVICAWVMWRWRVGREEALEIVKEGRGVGGPNEGFWEQLGMWGAMLDRGEVEIGESGEREGRKKAKL